MFWGLAVCFVFLANIARPAVTVCNGILNNKRLSMVLGTTVKQPIGSMTATWCVVVDTFPDYVAKV